MLLSSHLLILLSIINLIIADDYIIIKDSVHLLVNSGFFLGSKECARQASFLSSKLEPDSGCEVITHCSGSYGNLFGLTPEPLSEACYLPKLLAKYFADGDTGLVATTTGLGSIRPIGGEYFLMAVGTILTIDWNDQASCESQWATIKCHEQLECQDSAEKCCSSKTGGNSTTIIARSDECRLPLFDPLKSYNKWGNLTVG